MEHKCKRGAYCAIHDSDCSAVRIAADAEVDVVEPIGERC